MGVHCCGSHATDHRRFGRMLWVALAINAGMFALEATAGLAAGSASLQADSLDFLGDAANSAISLTVLGLTLRRRAQASLVKGASMMVFGAAVLAGTIHNAWTGTIPEAHVMGWVGFAALIANLAVAAMLYALRDGDSNMRSAWICSRNDAIGNLAVLVAASGVFATGTGWPDFAVAAVMAGLALWGGAQVLSHARRELALPHPAPDGPMRHGR